MARPKADDPKQALQIRIPGTVYQWWTEVAEREGTTVGKKIQAVLEERAKRG